MKNFIIATFLFIGVIDQIEKDIVFVVAKNAGEEQKEYLLPIDLIPCYVDEGDMIYAQIVDGVTEIRCGEPPI